MNIRILVRITDIKSSLSRKKAYEWMKPLQRIIKFSKLRYSFTLNWYNHYIAIEYLVGISQEIKLTHSGLESKSSIRNVYIFLSIYRLLYIFYSMIQLYNITFSLILIKINSSFSFLNWLFPVLFFFFKEIY
jgi:hypothetical protein